MIQRITQQKHTTAAQKHCRYILLPLNTSSMATSLSELYTASPQLFASRSKPAQGSKSNCASTVSAFPAKSNQESHGQEPRKRSSIPLQTSRRASVGLAVTTLLHQLATGAAHAYEPENNGYWLTSPLPVPTVTNKISNEETGTRSFVKKGIYIANIGPHGSAYRIRQYAFDLLALGDLLGQDAWSMVSKYLCLKSTIMYFDFDKVISAVADDQKEPLINLANRLFDNVEKLEDAVKQRSESMTQSYYADTEVILKELMPIMASMTKLL